MSDEFIKRVGEADQKLDRFHWPDFQCQLAGGPRVSLPPLPSPFALGQALVSWNASLTANSSLAQYQLRARIQPFSRIPDVQNALQNATDDQKAAVEDVQQILSNTTSQLSEDVSEASFAKLSVEQQGIEGDDYHCIQANETLRTAFNRIVDNATSYMVRTQLLNSTGMLTLQNKVASGDRSGLLAWQLHQQYDALMQYCRNGSSIY